MRLSLEQDLLTSFKSLVRIRMIEEAIALRYTEQKMRCPVHLSIGQEAIAVGVCEQLAPSDYVLSNHRSHAHYLAKGGSLKKMIAELYGKATGCTSGKGGSMHLIDLDVNVIGTTPIVGGSLPVGVGVAFSSYLKNESNITALFFGEASTEEGVWAESLNIAALHRLPLLLICENNFYSCYSPMEVRQAPKRSRLAIAEAHGISIFSGNGNDLTEVLQLAGEAVKTIRQGNGPCYLELETYRYREHCGPFEDPKGYRPEKEVAYWKERCPVDWAIKSLKIPDQVVGEIRASCAQEIEEAFHFAESSPFPTYNPNEKIYA